MTDLLTAFLSVFVLLFLTIPALSSVSVTTIEKLSQARRSKILQVSEEGFSWTPFGVVVDFVVSCVGER